MCVSEQNVKYILYTSFSSPLILFVETFPDILNPLSKENRFIEKQQKNIFRVKHYFSKKNCLYSQG